MFIDRDRHAVMRIMSMNGAGRKLTCECNGRQESSQFKESEVARKRREAVQQADARKREEAVKAREAAKQEMIARR